MKLREKKPRIITLVTYEPLQHTFIFMNISNISWYPVKREHVTCQLGAQYYSNMGMILMSAHLLMISRYTSAFYGADHLDIILERKSYIEFMELNAIVLTSITLSSTAFGHTQQREKSPESHA